MSINSKFKYWRLWYRAIT